MKRSDLEKAYSPVPEGFRGALTAAVRDVREENIMKKRHISLLAALIVIALLCGTAFALANYYSVRDYQHGGQPSGEFDKHIIEINRPYENEYIKAVFGDTVFDGQTMALTMNLFSKDETKPVFLFPTLEGYCGDRKLTLDIEGMRGLDQSGFLFPSLTGEEEKYLDHSYGLDASLYEDTADSEVKWVFTLRVLLPNWEIIDSETELHGDENDMPMDEYMNLFRAAYEDQKIMTAYGYSLVEYAAAASSTPDNLKKFKESKDMSLYEELIACGAFTLADTIETTFLTPLPEVKTIENKVFAFDGYTATLNSLTVSFMRIKYDITRTYSAPQTERDAIFDSYELRDQNGAPIDGMSGTGGMDGDENSHRFTGSVTLTDADVTAITFVPCAMSVKDNKPVYEYDEARAFTVEIK